MKRRFRRFLPSIAILAAVVGLATAGETAPPPRWPIELRERPVLGKDTAPVVASFKCSHCRVFHETIFPRLREEYVDTGKVQWVVLNASDDPSDEFAKIFPVARCALRRGKYWELLESLFQVAHRPSSFLTELIAKSPLLDSSELDICLRDRVTRNAVAADFSEYAHLKLHGTPSFLVSKLAGNGQRTETTVAGLQTLEYFRRVLDKMLETP